MMLKPFAKKIVKLFSHGLYTLHKLSISILNILVNIYGIPIKIIYIKIIMIYEHNIKVNYIAENDGWKPTIFADFLLAVPIPVTCNINYFQIYFLSQLLTLKVRRRSAVTYKIADTLKLLIINAIIEST